MAQMPYKGWNNKRVTEQVCEGYRLPKPAACPDEIYRVMIDCWNKNVQVCVRVRSSEVACACEVACVCVHACVFRANQFPIPSC